MRFHSAFPFAVDGSRRMRGPADSEGSHTQSLHEYTGTVPIHTAARDPSGRGRSGRPPQADAHSNYRYSVSARSSGLSRYRDRLRSIPARECSATTKKRRFRLTDIPYSGRACAWRSALLHRTQQLKITPDSLNRFFRTFESTVDGLQFFNDLFVLAVKCARGLGQSAQMNAGFGRYLFECRSDRPRRYRDRANKQDRAPDQDAFCARQFHVGTPFVNCSHSPKGSLAEGCSGSQPMRCSQ